MTMVAISNYNDFVIDFHFYHNYIKRTFKVYHNQYVVSKICQVHDCIREALFPNLKRICIIEKCVDFPCAFLSMK